MLQPFAVAGNALESFRRYVRSSFPLRDPALDTQRERLIDEGLLWTEPHVSLARPGSTGPKLTALAGLLLERAIELPWGFEELYEHQRRAIERLVVREGGRPQNTLILSGTGSGKTEGFLIPIVDACLRNPGPGVKALIIYPMNALANDQLARLHRLLGACPEVTFGRYTGDTPETDAGDQRRPGRRADLPANFLWSRQAMRDAPPNILLTNYSQLEYLLLRGTDQQLFRYGPPIYLVVDEIHLFTGVLGAEVACLLRRFRQHTGAMPDEICMVGTSATAGNEEEQDRLVAFVERFFGAPFAAEAAIAETPAPFGDEGTEIPRTPEISLEDLEAADTVDGLAALAKRTFGLELGAGDDFPHGLGRAIDRFRTVSTVERALERPAPISAAGRALGQLPDRAGVAEDALAREATAIVLLGATARTPAVGEEELQPRFRPRVHQIIRSLAGLWRCLNPDCGALVATGQSRCPHCGSLALPLASCRTCGEAYWSSPAQGEELTATGWLSTREYRRGERAIFLARPDRLPTIVDEDEEGQRVEWTEVAACPSCGYLGHGGAVVSHDRACPRPTSHGVPLRASTDAVHCPSCGDIGARNRPILLPFRGAAAASVAVLTQMLSDNLRRREGEAGGRLLVFADSRQDAAQQAGYADDQGGRIAVRQLISATLGSGEKTLLELARTVQKHVVEDPKALRRWLIGESERAFSEVAHPDYEPSHEDEEHIGGKLQWEVVLELTERSRRRFSLEQEGVITVGLDRLDELVGAVKKAWPSHPFGSDERLAQVVLATVDVLRHGRAVDHWMLKLSPRSLRRNHHVRIGDRAVTASRGYGPKKWRSAAKQVDIRAWTAPKHVTRMTELLARVLKLPTATAANEAVEALASRIQAVGLLSSSTIEGRKRQMVDHKRLIIARREQEPLFRCDRCGRVRSTILTDIEGKPLCATWRCPGRPEVWEPHAERDFYRNQYLAPPRRLLVHEHSGQIEADERIALEERFNDRDHPTIDVIACTPTLEVGVSLDDLHAVILRNMPPTPANYAQRVGRAGRRSKVALALGHAGQGPHDSYFFERPADLIAGLVRAPTMSLENEPLLERHLNSLMLEILKIDLPRHWVRPIDEEGFEGSTVADDDGVLRETTLKPFEEKLADPEVRKQVEEAVQGAFASSLDPSPPAGIIDLCRRRVDQFLPDLRVALNRWCDRYRALLDEYEKFKRKKGVPTKAEEAYERRLLAELRRLASPAAIEHRPLGFLGTVGFLPRYGFTGTSVLLHVQGQDEPIAQAGWVAVTEFAPANIVYARGRRLKVQRLDPAPVEESDAGWEHRDNVLRQARRCDRCEFLSFDPLTKSCPHCESDLVSQTVIELSGVRGGGGSISSDDEFRSRSDYDVVNVLSDGYREREQITLGGLGLERTAGREIIVANRGASQSDHPRGGFAICSQCGFAEEAVVEEDEQEQDEEVQETGHAPRCPGLKDRNHVKSGVWLTARVRGDVMEIALPPAVRGPHFASWRATLLEALQLGIRETVQAGRRDLSGFIRQREEEPHSIVIFDTMPGGTGYLPKLFANGAGGLKAAAEEVLRRLEGCTCGGSCYRCLRDFWNQRSHDALNRFEVLGVLRRLAEAQAVEWEDEQDDRLESFLELEFYERLTDGGLPLPTLQVTREIGSRRIIRVDAEYRDPDVSIFLDGRAYHAQSIEKIEDDIAKRNVLEERGICVLEFTYKDVLERFDSVAAAVRRARNGETADADLDPRALPGVQVVQMDEAKRRAVVEVDAQAWVRHEDARAASLSSVNRMRLAGWRLQRQLS